ncbi:long-chain fatty acid--CoA ligase [Ammoniphilus sp. CFH 90114]|uniref:LuxE/PaaK family acyltransferase n=1 Tax=Ammoniphilus sp. CFH 90114 TaxID=2493665 RepID=UPI00100EEBCC|nr:long-chain fatty acid--CoA ligase [Ammoniphilus sp. CFH 90114]RXT05687.1 long-chain fatty acid--CoA ligase [Ammoniphilus sp. CFH 90114]
MKYETLKHQAREFILSDSATEEEFNQWALTLFAYQYENNAPFRKYCRKRRVSPSTVTYYWQIPAVPIGAFKEAALSCCPPEEAQAVFMTSGTTNPEKKGKNYHQDLEIWDLSMKKQFKNYILPDVDKIRMAILFPTEQELPNSSLAHYLHLGLESFGLEGSEYMFSEQGMETEKLTSFLRKAEVEGDPILVIGATFSFIHYLDECRAKGMGFQLPKGSRIMDTGGAKGRSREMDPEELRGQLCDLFGVPPYGCINMYGMSELSSQFYDAHYRDHILQNPTVSSYKKAPHWVRTVMVDPATMERKASGEKGIIIHYDLANLNSVLAIMTEDVGVSMEDGSFLLLGRAAGAEAKGCSLAVEQFVASKSESKA